MSPFNLLLKLSYQAKAICKPNPAVACVIIKNGQVLSQGHTQKWGGSHAEVITLSHVKDKSLLLGSEMWVTLTPCCFYGKTPPCTEKILESGIKKIHIALADPNPKVADKSLIYFKKKGIIIIDDFPEEVKWELFKLNFDFFKKITHQHPAITLKYAMTLDGKMATQSYHSKWITNKEAREDVHKNRQYHDAILVGENTLLKDNPRFNIRLQSKSLPINPFQPLIITALSKNNLNTPLIKKLKIFKKKVVLGIPENSKKHPLIKSLNLELINIYLYKKEEKFFNKKQLKKISQDFNLNSIFVEGGPKTQSFFLKQKLVDKIDIYLGNKILGDGKNALSPFYHHLKPTLKITSGFSLEKPEFKVFKDNLKISGLLKKTANQQLWKRVKTFKNFKYFSVPPAKKK